MTSNTPPPPPQQQPQSPVYYKEPQSRSVSFYVAIFLLLLLLLSGALNVLLLVVGAVSGAANATFGTSVVDDGDSLYDLVATGGDPKAKVRILRLPIEGAIAEERTPLLGAAGGTVSQVRRALRTARREKPTIAAVLLDIDSPGGGVTDSDEIWRLVREFKQETRIPVWALFGDLAASGGYYVASACDRILARPTSTTGSIGVIMSGYNFAEAAKKLGVEQVTIVSAKTPYKDLLSPMRAPREDETRLLRTIVDEMYTRFVDVVAMGRPALDRDQVEKLADGRIYSANQAKQAGLVDDIVDVEQAVTALREQIKAERVQIVELRRRPNLGELLFGVRAAPKPTLEQSLAHLLHSTSGPRLLYLWQGGR